MRKIRICTEASGAFYAQLGMETPMGTIKNRLGNEHTFCMQ